MPLVLLAAVVLAGCSASPSADASSSTSTSTTTTLPSPVVVRGYDLSGVGAAFGPVWRIPVASVAPGTYVPSATQLAPGATITETRIGFHQFGSGPDLLLIAGAHATMSWWQLQLLSDLGGHFRVTFFDLPGVGYSSSTRPIRVEAYADDVAGLIYALGLKTPTVLGWGLGGDVALALAERHSLFVSHLVLADVPAPGNLSSAPLATTAALFASDAVTMTELSLSMFPKSAEVERLAWLQAIAQVPADDIVANSIHAEEALTDAVSHDQSLASGLHLLHMPTLVITGDTDELVPAANASALQQAITRARLITEPGAGYGALFQDESVLFPKIVTFAGS